MASGASAAAALIPGWQTGVMVDDGAIRQIYADISTLTASPLVGNLESCCNRVEALCAAFGKLTEALLPVIPAANISTNNLTSVATHLHDNQQRIDKDLTTTRQQNQQMEAHLLNIQAQSQHLEQKLGYINSSSKYSKTAAESKAIQNIKPLVSDKKEFRLWHNKFINAITQIHTGARIFFEEITTHLDAHEFL